MKKSGEIIWWNRINAISLQCTIEVVHQHSKQNTLVIANNS